MRCSTGQIPEPISGCDVRSRKGALSVAPYLFVEYFMLAMNLETNIFSGTVREGCALLATSLMRGRAASLCTLFLSTLSVG